MSKLNPKLILFDFDGTVADTGRGIFNCVGYAASAFGWALPDEEALRSFVGPPLLDSFRRVFGVSEEQALSAVEKYRELYSTEGMFQFDVYEGITQVIEAVRSEGIKTAVATSKPDRFIHLILEKAGLADLFDYVSAPLDKNGETAKTVLINRALDFLNIEPSFAVMVGDRHYDIEGAEKSGVRAVGVTWGYGSENELVCAGADYTVASPAELLALISA